MPVPLSDLHKAILDGRFFAFVTTLYPDGSPHTTIVWVDHDGENVTFNSAAGRLKVRHLRRDPRLSVAVHDPADPYSRTVIVHGRAEISEEGALEHIHRLAHKYLGTDYPWLQPGERRVKITVRADRILEG